MWRHAAESSERSKLLVTRRREADANVAFVQGNVFVDLCAVVAGPLEGDGVGRYRTTCLGVSLGLALLGKYLWNEDVDWRFR